jgi:hypothetical protein
MIAYSRRPNSPIIYGGFETTKSALLSAMRTFSNGLVTIIARGSRVRDSAARSALSSTP